MSQKADQDFLDVELEEVDQLTECLFALNRSVNDLKTAIKGLNGEKVRSLQVDSEELQQLLPKPTLH